MPFLVLPSAALGIEALSQIASSEMIPSGPAQFAIAALMVGGVFEWGSRRLKDLISGRQLASDPNWKDKAIRRLDDPYRGNAGEAFVPSFDGVVFTRHANGSPERARLSSPQVIQGVPCVCTRDVYFHDNGRLWGAVLAADAELQGKSIPAGSRVESYKNGSLLMVILSKDRALCGVPCKGLVWGIWFHPNGRLWRAFLSRDYEIEHESQKILCPQDTWILLDESGRLQT